MSQQAMFPESQEPHSQDDEIAEAQPYYWSTQPKGRTSGNMPKNEHPSTFEATIPPHAYHAQEPRQEPRQEQVRATSQRQYLSPDGDAFEQGYRPYQQPAQVPPWARPQTNNRGMWRWFPILIIGFMLLPMLLHLVAGLFVLAGAVILIFVAPVILLAVVIGGIALLRLLLFRGVRIPMRRRGWYGGPWQRGGPMRWGSPRRW